MSDGKCAVGGCVPGSEARTAERRLHHNARVNQLRKLSIFHKFQIHRHRCRVDAQGKCVRSDALSFEDVRRIADVFKSAAGTTCNDSLIAIQLSVTHLAAQGIFNLVSEGDLRSLFHLLQHLRQVLLDLLDCVNIAWMERHGDHRTDRGQIHFDAAVIVGCPRRRKRTVSFLSSMDLIEFPDRLIRLPDRAQAGGLRRHDIHADPEIRAQLRHAGPDKFHDLIFDIPLLEDRANDCKRDILRADAAHRLARQVHRNHPRHVHIPGLSQKLLHQLSAALADCHGSQRAVAGVGIRAKDHAAALREHFPCKLVDDRLMRRDIDSAVFFCGRQAKHVVILIDRSTDSAQGIMAIGQYIGYRETFQAGGAGSLNDAYICDIVAGHFVKMHLQFFVVLGLAVRVQDRPGNRAPPRGACQAVCAEA